MLKKPLALLLAIIICAAMLAACGSGGSADNSKTPSAGEVTVEEQTIFDDQGIKAVVKGYGKLESEFLSFDNELLIDVTNDTDRDISFGLNRFSVNGCMFESYYSYTIKAGETATYPAVFDSEKLESYGITTIADYEFCIVVEDEETYETLVESDPIVIKTSAFEGFEYNYDESGTVMYDAGGIKIIAKDTLVDEYLGPCVNFYVVNDTDKNISVCIDSGSVNGKDVQDYYYGSDPCAGKRSIDLMSIGEEERPEKIESLTLSFGIYDWDTGDVIVEKTDPATVTF